MPLYLPFAIDNGRPVRLDVYKVVNCHEEYVEVTDDAFVRVQVESEGRVVDLAEVDIVRIIVIKKSLVHVLDVLVDGVRKDWAGELTEHVFNILINVNSHHNPRHSSAIVLDFCHNFWLVLELILAKLATNGIQLSYFGDDLLELSVYLLELLEFVLLLSIVEAFDPLLLLEGLLLPLQLLLLLLESEFELHLFLGQLLLQLSFHILV